MSSKNYNGQIYIKKDLQQVLTTEDLEHINSSISVLFFPNDVSLERVLESLETIKVNLKDRIKYNMEEKVDTEDKRGN